MNKDNNNKLVLDIKRLGINGEGIAYYKKKACFINYAIPGEKIECKLLENLEKRSLYEISSIIKRSPYRKKAECMYYKDCGACTLMHINKEGISKFKKELVYESLKKYTDIDINSFYIKDLNQLDEFYYRNKSLIFVRKVNGINSLSMIKEKSNISFKIDSCMCHYKEIDNINKLVIDISNDMNIKTFPEKDYSFSYILTRYSKKTQDSLVCIICKEKNHEVIEFVKRLNSKKIAKSIYLCINDFKSHELINNNLECFSNKTYIEEYIGDIRYKILPNTFFQLNTNITHMLYEGIRKCLKLSKKEVLLDLYCGIGSISLYLSKYLKEAIGVEINKDSIRLANENKLLNKINNVNFFVGDCENLFLNIVNKYNIDILVLDPPRTGISTNLLNYILKSNISKIVYISCNHSTLSKNLDILTKKYKIRFIDLYDMFPNTSHVESLSLLDLKK